MDNPHSKLFIFSSTKALLTGSDFQIDDGHQAMFPTLRHVCSSQCAAQLASASLRDDVLPFLKHLAIGGHKVALLSDHVFTIIKPFLEKKNLGGFITSRLTPYDLKAQASPINKGARLEKYVELLRINPKDVFVVGTSTEGVRLAQANKLNSIVVTDGNPLSPSMTALRPSLSVFSLKEIPSVLQDHAVIL